MLCAGVMDLLGFDYRNAERLGKSSWNGEPKSDLNLDKLVGEKYVWRCCL